MASQVFKAGSDGRVTADYDPLTGRLRFLSGEKSGYLDQPIQPYSITLSSDAPTITTNATATISGGQVLDPDHAAITYYSHSGLFRMSGYLLYNGGGQLTHMEFMTNSACLELGIIRYTAQFRVFVDGVPASAPISNDASGSATFYKLTFASQKIRRITVVGVNMPIYQVVLTAGDAIWQAPDDLPLMCVAGDSYTFGNGGNGGVAFSWAQLFGRELGYRVIVDAIGGTGWTSTGNNAPLTRLGTVGANVMTKRVAGVNYPRTPESHVVALGYNNAGVSAATVSARCSEYIAASTVKPAIVGPWTPAGETAGLIEIKAGLKASADAAGCKFIDISDLVTTANKGSLIDSDAVHPLLIGHQYHGHLIAVRARAANAA